MSEFCIKNWTKFSIKLCPSSFFMLFCIHFHVSICQFASSLDAFKLPTRWRSIWFNENNAVYSLYSKQHNSSLVNSLPAETLTCYIVYGQVAELSLHWINEKLLRMLVGVLVSSSTWSPFMMTLLLVFTWYCCLMMVCHRKGAIVYIIWSVWYSDGVLTMWKFSILCVDVALKRHTEF